MEKDPEESDDSDEKIGIGIRKRIRDKFKTIVEEIKEIKAGIMYLLFNLLLFSNVCYYKDQ